MFKRQVIFFNEIKGESLIGNEFVEEWVVIQMLHQFVFGANMLSYSLVFFF